jgi:hypothetical protein
VPRASGARALNEIASTLFLSSLAGGIAYLVGAVVAFNLGKSRPNRRR